MDRSICNFDAALLELCNYSSLKVYLELPDILTKLKIERLFHKSPELLPLRVKTCSHFLLLEQVEKCPAFCLSPDPDLGIVIVSRTKESQLFQ